MDIKRRIISVIMLMAGLCYLLHVGKETEDNISKTFIKNESLFYEMLETDPYNQENIDFTTDGIAFILMDVTGDNEDELLAVLPFATALGHKANYKTFAFDLRSQKLLFSFYGRIFTSNSKYPVGDKDMGVFRCQTKDGNFVLLANEVITQTGINVITTEIRLKGTEPVYTLKRLFGTCESENVHRGLGMIGLELNPDLIDSSEENLIRYRTGEVYRERTSLMPMAIAVSEEDDPSETIPSTYENYLKELTILDSKGVCIGHLYKNSEQASNVDGLTLSNGKYILEMENKVTDNIARYIK